MAKKAAANPNTRRCDATFGSKNVGVGNRVTITCKVARNADHQDASWFDDYLVCAQISVALIADKQAKGDVPGQGKFIDTSSASMSGIGEVRSVRMMSDHCQFSISFGKSSLNDAALAALDHLAGKSGTMEFERLGDIAGDDAGDE
jgi:hypothetical protein